MDEKVLVGIALLAAGAVPSQAMAASVLGGNAVVASDGNVIAKFISQAAGYDNELYLDSPSNSLGRIFHNHLNSPGDTVDLGFFTAGTELIFRLYVVNTGQNFYTGPGSRNPDGIPHAIVDDSFAPGETSVGFEDLYGGGDRDYDDTVFSFTNVKARVVPLPAAAWMGMTLLGGLGVIGKARSRKS